MTKLNIIGSQVRALRKSQKLTQEELATKCNLLGFDVSRSTLAKIEAEIRQVTDIELFIIAKALNININQLFII
ncbi:helix-turn-helix transcriptional regulator [Photobacterium damselae subsp. damselae]|uniref:Helix-turn-helix transcriptional regulator n=1 Tax=Photobacterium damselae subsp. damselae TaxID=85581 RepID=A0A850QVF3_PHODD|nr:helix-turn-helix transcriptional regulator [Photobacterium damselae subsp. damselae]